MWDNLLIQDRHHTSGWAPIVLCGRRLYKIETAPGRQLYFMGAVCTLKIQTAPVAGRRFYLWAPFVH